MKFIFLFLLWLAVAAAQGQDFLVLKNGRKAECRVLDFTTEAVRISYRATPTVPFAERLVPLAEVDYVEWAPLPGEPEALAEAVRAGRSEPLIGFWVKRLPYLNRPRSNAGEIGLTYAELLTRVSTADRMERALKIYQQIETSDWNEGRRGRAQAGRLRVMLRQGKTQEVLPLAEALLEKSGDPRVLIDLRHVMAEASAATLTQLEKDHPRWEEEEELIPRYHQLLNDALDGYLHAHLFHGVEEDLAARGLWAAVQLSASRKLPEDAASWALDLTHLYPGQPEAAAAKTWLEKQPVPIISAGGRVRDNPPPANEEEEEAQEPAPEPKPAKPRAKPKTKSKPKPAKQAAGASPPEEAADE